MDCSRCLVSRRPWLGSHLVSATPLVIGIGGSSRVGSTTSRLLDLALAHAGSRGAMTKAFRGDQLAELPLYGVDAGAAADARVRELIDAAGAAAGIVVTSPGYHGGIAGVVKNALDHLELLRGAPRPYLDGRAVGLIVAAAGWQATGTTVTALRSTVHALRGWPTPFAATVNTALPVRTDTDEWVDSVSGAVRLVADQVMDFVGWTTAQWA